MNKRKVKKMEKLFQESNNFGFYEIQKYRKIKEVRRWYHDYLICCKRTESAVDDFIKELN